MVMPVGWTSLAGLPEGVQPGPEQAARQFEALLIQHLLKTMREAGQPQQDSEAGTGGETYLELAEQQLAGAMAQRGGLGIARMVLQGLRQNAVQQKPEVTVPPVDKRNR